MTRSYDALTKTVKMSRANDGVSYEQTRSYARSYDTCSQTKKRPEHDGVPYERRRSYTWSYEVCTVTMLAPERKTAFHTSAPARMRARMAFRGHKEAEAGGKFSLPHLFLLLLPPKPLQTLPQLCRISLLIRFQFKPFHVIDLWYVSPPIPNLFLANPCSMCLALPCLGYTYF